jgi:hypothetical protein
MIDSIEIIKSLQNDIFSKLKRCWGHNIWFIIQINIGSYLFNISNNFFNIHELLTRGTLSLKGDYFYFFKKFLKSLYYILCNYRKYKNRLNETTILAGYRNQHYTERNGCLYNIYLEPYQTLLNEEGTKNEIIWVDKLYNDEFFMALYNINYFILIMRKLLFSKQFDNVKFNSNLLYSRLKDKYKKSKYLPDFISNKIIAHKLYFDIFRCYLKILSPQKLWTIVYYDIDTMNPLIKAANSLHIETAEYQHSHFSDCHCAYTKWNYIDEYHEYFPKSFFVWNDIYKNTISRNFTGKIYKPQIIISGNYYIKQEKSDIFMKSTSNDILVCLQGKWIPEFVENAVINSNDIKWYFRLHPRSPYDKEKLFSFASSNPDKIEIDKANKLTLYELFESVSTILTIFSGAALEAKEFGLQVIIVDPYGYNSYKDYIVNGDFAYAENEDQLLKLIQKKVN